MLLFLLAASLAAACGVIASHVGFSRGLSFILAAGILSVGLMLRRTFKPPAFDFTVERNHIEFEFADPEYAEVFRAQNRILGNIVA